ncbi:hypothetical protein WJX81_003671 [Elliptochloris bilobata]|uniref:UBX domain-containing protein n=1 Tax=Elliptochloris bilobata TaxID=381761 RepID=A0AAW1RIV4_9CHLO
MLSGELASRMRKLEREQQARLEKLRAREEKERLVAQRQAERERAREEEIRQRRLAQEAAREAERLWHEEELQVNNGVWWQAALSVVPADEGAARSKGIKRGADKVLLPPSVGAELMRQDAPKNGAQLFELHPEQASAASGAGVSGRLTVTYRRLLKGVYARLQPAVAEFQKEVGGDVREVLEAALARHSTLSEGDWLTAAHAGRSYELRVQKLHPAAAVSVIDTEMEAEVEPSIETQARLLAAEQEERLRQEELARVAAEREAQARAEAEAAEAAQAAAAAIEEQRADDHERRRQASAAELRPEPPLGEPGVATCVVRLPDGRRCAQRFRGSDPLGQLFAWVDAQGGGGAGFGPYNLVAMYPRRVVSLGGGTLAEAGLAGGQETLVLEPAGGLDAQQAAQR